MGPGERPFSRARFAHGVAPFALGLPFMAFFLIPILTDPPPLGRLVTGLALLVVVCVQYVGTATAADLPLGGRWCYVVVFTALMIGGLAIIGGWYTFALSTYLTIMIGMLIPWRQARVAILIWLIISLLVGVVAELWVVIVMAVIAGGVGLAMGIGMEASRVERHLQGAEQRIATLAVVAERERIARDLHDILGHSLTAITVKAGLAARLADRDLPAAKAQMVEVEAVARQALSDVRATASGLGQVRLATEIAGARSVLAAAGVECESPTAIEPLPDALSEFFGYVVREGVTNVVRHAHATRCVISVRPGEVSLADDGVGLTRRGGGSGLQGLAVRAAQVGGVVTTIEREHGGTVLTARAPLGPGSEAKP